MKKINLLLVTVLVAITGLFAQSPQQFKYQAVLRNTSGDIMANESVNVNIKILKSSASGTEVFSEDHNGLTTTAQGLININVGETSDLSDVNWGTDAHFIKVSVNGAEIGTSQLLSVPYALNAGNAYWNKSSIGEIYYNDGSFVGIGTTNPVADFQVERNSNATNSQMYIKQSGSGDATMALKAGDNAYCIGVDNNDDDKFKISKGFDAGTDNLLTIKQTGELGIGTQNPSAALHVVGGMKVGATGKQINEIIELTGTTSPSLDYASVDFPAGYTIDNTRVLSLEIKRNNLYWRSLGTTQTGADGSIYTSVSSKIFLYYPNHSEYKNREYRLTIMKVE